MTDFEIKLIEVRDHATCISAIAIKISTTAKVAQMSSALSHVIFGYLGNGLIYVNPYDWRGCNIHTMRPVHIYLQEHWNEVRSGQLLDARVLRGETDTSCVSDYSQDD